MTKGPLFEELYIPEPNSGCWLWFGSTFKDKGGNRTYGRYGKKSRLAHRISYEKHHNISLVSVDLVCHTCDNPPCVNPDHLYIGTPKSNMDDMVRRGRSIKGSGVEFPN